MESVGRCFSALAASSNSPAEPRTMRVVNFALRD